MAANRRQISRFAARADMPPSAMTGAADRLANRRKRIGPSVGAPGWDRVAKAGDSSTASALARLAMAISRAEWAERRRNWPVILRVREGGP